MSKDKIQEDWCKDDGEYMYILFYTVIASMSQIY